MEVPEAKAKPGQRDAHQGALDGLAAATVAQV
jgi:hypothetical protein